MSELEKEFVAIKEEIADKVAQAVKLLQEASSLAGEIGSWSAFDGDLYPGLRDVVSEFFTLDASNDTNGWTCSFY